MPLRVDSGLSDGSDNSMDAWEGFSDDSADEDQMWAERDEWHQWRNRIDSQVSGALGTSTAPSAMGRFARMKTKGSKADRTNPLQFGKFRAGASPRALHERSMPRSGSGWGSATTTAASSHKLTASHAQSQALPGSGSGSGSRHQPRPQQPQQPQQPHHQPRGGSSSSLANAAQQFLGAGRFDDVVVAARPASGRGGGGGKTGRRKKKKELGPLAQAKRAQLRKLDAARWERRGDRTRFLAQYPGGRLPSYQDVLDTKRHTGADPVLSPAAAAAASARLHGTATMAQLVARKVDPATTDPARLAELVDEAREKEQARAARRRRGKAAAANFGASANILGRQAHRAQVRKARVDKLQQTVAQTKFRRRKQQLSRRKWDEYNAACAAAKQQSVDQRYEERAARLDVVLESPDTMARRERAARARAEFLRRGQGVNASSGVRGSVANVRAPMSDKAAERRGQGKGQGKGGARGTAGVAVGSKAAGTDPVGAGAVAEPGAGTGSRGNSAPLPSDRRRMGSVGYAAPQPAPLRVLRASEAVEFLSADVEAAAAARENLSRFMPLPKSVTAYRSYGALGEAVAPPFGSAALPRDSARQVKLYDPMTGPKL